MPRLSSLARRMAALALALCSGAITASAQSKIEYRSVAEARSALSAKPGAIAKDEDGWLVVVEPDTHTLWSFTPQGHEAHPAVVRRSIVQQGSDVFVDMDIRCEATTPACDGLAESFQALNAEVRRDLSGGK